MVPSDTPLYTWVGQKRRKKKAKRIESLSIEAGCNGPDQGRATRAIIAEERAGCMVVRRGSDN